jgi:hypothetical protein
MREFCLTEEVIQRFIDGELSPEQTEGAAAHVAACERCTSLLSEVEAENSLLMEAFAPEMSLTVPTVRLRERLDAAIAELEPRPVTAGESSGSRLRAWFGSLFGPFSFTPQQSLGFASLAVVLAFAAIFAVIQLRHGRESAAPAVAGIKPAQPRPQAPAETTVKGGNNNPEAATPTSAEATATPEIINAGFKPRPRVNAAKRPGKPAVETAKPNTPTTAAPKLLPGERSYLEAIASLTTAIDANKDDVLKPTVRADYERNLAVVDQAIATTRQQVKRNPSDRDAAEFMYMAYQNKIELLSAVADRTRMASR